MADLEPFRAWHYDPARVRLADVLTEPYDKISPELQEQYYRRSPHNFVRIELGRAGEQPDQYAAAARTLASWRREGVLTQRPRPAFYRYQQTFPAPDQRVRTRRALIGRVRLSPFSEGKVLPHEQTLPQPKTDRLNLLRAAQVYTGQIFLLYDGQKVKLPSAEAVPMFEFSDNEGVQHGLAAIEEKADISAIQKAFSGATLTIADGHHRYETALAYRDERRSTAGRADASAPYEFVMAALVDFRDPDVLILPTHRVVKAVTDFDGEKLRERLGENFQMERHPDWGTLQRHLEGTPRGSHCLGFFLPPNQFWLLRLRTKPDRGRFFAGKPPLWETLDVAILHAMILEPLLGIGEEQLRQQSHVEYYRDARAAALRVEHGGGQAAFFLRPTPAESVIAVAEARSRMPQKSTDFYPKFPSGLTLYDVSGKF